MADLNVPEQYAPAFKSVVAEIVSEYPYLFGGTENSERYLFFRRSPQFVLEYVQSKIVFILQRLVEHLPKANTGNSDVVFSTPLHALINREEYRNYLYSTLQRARLPHSGETYILAPWLERVFKSAESFSVLQPLLDLEIPVPLSRQNRFNHTHIIGGTGAGKTTLLENFILHDLKSPNPPGLVVIDSQGDLIPKITKLALWEKRDYILITPKDIEYPPALNVFALKRDRLNQYSQAEKEQVVAGVIQTFDYLFSGLLGADLTAKQGVFFKYVARLMLSLPETMGRNATILDMLRLMEDVTPYRSAIASLPDLQRSFFERDFGSKTFAQTKEQIRYRLHAVIENPTLARLFTSTETKIDLFTELNKGTVILVDTAKDFLKGASANFGRIFISLVLQAVLERAAIPANQRKPAFLYVDEAAEYFDSNIDDLLTETRKYGLGCIFAHQYLDQCTSALRASLAANTAIKFAGGVSSADARSLAPDMRTKPEFILEQKRLHFAAHIRGVTPQAVSVPVRIGTLDAEPQLTPAEREAFIERNRARVAYTEPPSAPTPPAKMSDEY